MTHNILLINNKNRHAIASVKDFVGNCEVLKQIDEKRKNGGVGTVLFAWPAIYELLDNNNLQLITVFITEEKAKFDFGLVYSFKYSIRNPYNFNLVCSAEYKLLDKHNNLISDKTLIISEELSLPETLELGQRSFLNLQKKG